MLRTGLLFALLSVAAVAVANPDFTLQDIDGKQHRLSDYRGKWVVVNYWATWCPPCREEIPELVEFHERHKDHDAVVLGVNMEQVTIDKLRQFVEENFVSYPILPGSSDMATVGPVRGLPTTYLIAPDGRLVARQVGGVTAAGIESFINNQ
ncbi:TlpA family protein disulfide reductase [Sulfurivermis fontis]|uniref:TlpA family protein disulfide reductase n=1 Tax=Sulfurivermis fontis TaxID=1972068 RepID=UPI000FDB8EAE|nr:TlpA disulfide reductase family protein [Sulfurivermis fontis]